MQNFENLFNVHRDGNDALLYAFELDYSKAARDAQALEHIGSKRMSRSFMSFTIHEFFPYARNSSRKVFLAWRAQLLPNDWKSDAGATFAGW